MDHGISDTAHVALCEYLLEIMPALHELQSSLVSMLAFYTNENPGEGVNRRQAEIWQQL